MSQNRVTTCIKEHEGMSYIEVTSTSPTGEVVYSHSAWVDNDPRLHSLLVLHSWSLNARTGHLTTHNPQGWFLEALEAQGPVPAIVPLPRCLAAAVANGKKIKMVQADPTDYRLESLSIVWDRSTEAPMALTLAAPAEEARVLMVSEVQNAEVVESRRAEADRRRKEADERRQQAEQRAIARHFERLTAKQKAEERRADKIAGKALAITCRAQADIMLRQALARKEHWAIDVQRALAGHRVIHGAVPPKEYVRFSRGLPLLVSESEAQVEQEQRYKRSQAHFEQFCAGFRQRLAPAAMRTAWLELYPEHDWVEWNDDTTIPGASEFDRPVNAVDDETAVPLLPGSEEHAARMAVMRAEFDYAHDHGMTSGGLPPAEVIRWNQLFDACEDPDTTKNLRVRYDEAVREHAWACWQEEHK